MLKETFLPSRLSRAVPRENSGELWNSESGLKRPRNKRPGGKAGEGKSVQRAWGLGPSPSRSAESLPVADAVTCSLDSPWRTKGLISRAAESNPRRASQC